MRCAITSANKLSGQSVVISRISPVQLAVSARKPTLNRPFIFPILDWEVLLNQPLEAVRETLSIGGLPTCTEVRSSGAA